MQATHKVPTHMSLPDKVVFGLTARQLLLLLIGCSLGYNLWLHLSVVAAFILLWQDLSIGIPLVPVVLAVVPALIAGAGRPLDGLVLVLLPSWPPPPLYHSVTP